MVRKPSDAKLSQKCNSNVFSVVSAGACRRTRQTFAQTAATVTVPRVVCVCPGTRRSFRHLVKCSERTPTTRFDKHSAACINHKCRCHVADANIDFRIRTNVAESRLYAYINGSAHATAIESNFFHSIRLILSHAPKIYFN